MRAFVYSTSCLDMTVIRSETLTSLSHSAMNIMTSDLCASNDFLLGTLLAASIDFLLGTLLAIEE